MYVLRRGLFVGEDLCSCEVLAFVCFRVTCEGVVLCEGSCVGVLVI